MVLPDLAKEIAWWQAQMKPADPAFGAGFSDWTITSEYVPNLATPEHGDVWGLTVSPSSLPAIVGLTPEDIEAKRAHMMFRTPANEADLAELHETIAHESVHVLDARKTGSVADKENSAHSLAPLLAEFRKSAPERAGMLARALANPAMARAYRAGDGEMPDPAETDKDKEKKDPPQAQEGGTPRDPSAITADLVKAVLAGQPTDELAKELVAAQALAGAAGASLPAPAPEVPAMGMQQQDAYARAKKGEEQAVKDGIEAVIDGRPDLGDPQKALIRKQTTVAQAREVAKTYPLPAAQPATPTMGALGHPATAAGAVSVGGKKESPLARAVSEAQGDPLFRKAMGLGAADNDGVSYDVPGHIVYIDGSERLRHQRDAYRNRRAAQ